MSGRDAYFEMGFETSKSSDSGSVVPVNANPEPAPSAPLEPALSADPAPMPEMIDMEAYRERSGMRDYLAGLFLVLCVLLIGIVTGFFGRGFFTAPVDAGATLKILGTQPVPSLQSAGASVNNDVVYLGSNASDQVLALQAYENGDALVLTKSYLGSGPDQNTSQLLVYAASDATEQGHAVTHAKPLQGEGLGLTPLEDGSVVTAAIDDGDLVLTRVTAAGRKVWSSTLESGAIDRDEVSVAASDEGVIILSPNATRDRAMLVSLDANGQTRWQQSFDRPSFWQRAVLNVDPRGQSFAVIGAAEDSLSPADQNIVLVDADGRLIRQRILALNPNDTIVEATARLDGGVTYLVAGDAPRLIQLGASGQTIATVDLPYMQFLNDAHMIGLENGDVVIASTYALMGNRVDMVIEQRSPDGALVGQRTIELPPGATLDALVPVEESEYLISGSVRRDRYMPTDLFLQQVSFSPDPEQQFAMTSPATYTTASADLSDFAFDQPVAAAEVFEDTATAEAETPAIPVIASLTLAPVDAEANDAEASDTGAEVTELPEANAEEGAVETVSTTPEEITELGIDLAETIDLNAAAVSRFLEQSIVTQCRFTCMDSESGSTFPMTGHFMSSLLVGEDTANGVHAKVCQAADLIPVLETRPVCGIE